MSAIATAKALVDLRLSTAQETDKSKSRPKEKKFQKKTFRKKRVSWKSYVGKAREEKTQVESKQAGTSTKSTGCYICAGLLMAQECLEQEKLAALVIEWDSDSEPPSHINPLQLLGAFRL